MYFHRFRTIIQYLFWYVLHAYDHIIFKSTIEKDVHLLRLQGSRKKSICLSLVTVPHMYFKRRHTIKNKCFLVVEPKRSGYPPPPQNLVVNIFVNHFNFFFVCISPTPSISGLTTKNHVFMVSFYIKITKWIFYQTAEKKSQDRSSLNLRLSTLFQSSDRSSLNLRLSTLLAVTLQRLLNGKFILKKEHIFACVSILYRNTVYTYTAFGYAEIQSFNGFFFLKILN